MIQGCVLIVYGVAANLMDMAMKIQISVTVLFIALSSLMVHFTITMDTPVLGTCTVYERCHWCAHS